MKRNEPVLNVLILLLTVVAFVRGFDSFTLRVLPSFNMLLFALLGNAAMLKGEHSLLTYCINLGKVMFSFVIIGYSSTGSASDIEILKNLYVVNGLLVVFYFSGLYGQIEKLKFVREMIKV
ncbi:MAG: hypothetical protein N4A44_04300 [Alphaproteobacteria bacterium]|jgi:hypothetical protein|nr:hypothetical protein [Alphaproteobacteria bacterium]